MIFYIINQHNKVPIRILSKESCLRCIFLFIFLPAPQFLLTKIWPAALFPYIQRSLVCGPFDFSVLFSLPIYWGKGFASISEFGPKVFRRWSSVWAKIEMIDATPPTSALLKLCVYKIVHRSVVNSMVTLRGSRCGCFSSIWAMGMARSCRGFHIPLTSVLRLGCQ